MTCLFPMGILMGHIVFSVCFSATKLLPERKNWCIFPRFALSSMGIKLVAFIVNLWKIIQASWMKWQVRWYRLMFKLFRRVNKPKRTTEFYCQSLTFLKQLDEWAFLWGVTEMISNIIQKLESWLPMLWLVLFFEFLNLAVCQGNKDAKDHLKNCSTSEPYISKTT